MRASFFTHESFQKSDDRRGKIALAMDACMREKGFAATSLTDVAVKARMSPSHIRYYFESREEILEFYLGAIRDQLFIDIQAIPRTSPAQWIKDFTRYFIANPEMNRPTMKVMIDIFAVSAHNPKMMKIKASYDAFLRQTFVDFFAWAGIAPGVKPADAAYRLWVIESGMKFNSVFQPDFSKEAAGKLFEAELMRLSGLKRNA